MTILFSVNNFKAVKVVIISFQTTLLSQLFYIDKINQNNFTLSLYSHDTKIRQMRETECQLTVGMDMWMLNPHSQANSICQVCIFLPLNYHTLDRENLKNSSLNTRFPQKNTLFYDVFLVESFLSAVIQVETSVIIFI